MGQTGHGEDLGLAQATTLRDFLDAAPDGIVIVDRMGCIVDVNDATARLFGYTRAELVGGSVDVLVPMRFREAHERHRAGYVAEPRPRPMGVGLTLFGRRKDGTEFPVEISLSPLRTPRGQLVMSFIRDVTLLRQSQERDRQLERESAARAAAERAEGHAMLLVDASNALARSIDYEQTLAAIARLAVPRFADFCVVDLVEEPGAPPRQVALAHRDAAKGELVRRLRERLQPFREGPHGAAAVIRTGQSQISRAPAARLTEEIAADPEIGELIRELGLLSSIVVPMSIHGQTFGALAFATAESGRRYTRKDLELAEELARRAAVAVENARLFRAQQEAVGVRDEFLSIASHELRTPLTVLQLQLQSLGKLLPGGEAAEGAAARAKLAMATRQTGRLARLIDGLLDVSRMMSGRLRLELDEFDLSEMAIDVAERFAEGAAVAGCELVVDAHSPVVGRWDKLRTEQVLTNLLSNAIKYAPNTSVEIGVRAAGNDAFLTVRDHGIGIAEADMQRVFGRYQRAVSRRHYGGLGLGLHIAREIVAAHGGAISAESKPRLGSTFTVRLPLRPPPGPEPE